MKHQHNDLTNVLRRSVEIATVNGRSRGWPWSASYDPFKTFLINAITSNAYVLSRTAPYYMDRNIYDNVSPCYLIDVNNGFALSKYNLSAINKEVQRKLIK